MASIKTLKTSPLGEIKENLIKKIFNANKEIPKFTTDTFPIKNIYKDGIVELENKKFSKTIEFFDITYQLSPDDVKVNILEQWSELLNSFSDDCSVQLSFINQTINVADYEKAITIPRLPSMNPKFDEIRQEYSEILRNQFEKGNNSILKRKFVTLTVEANSLKEAKIKLEQVETSTLSNFNRLEVRAYSLNGNERINLLKIATTMENNKVIYDWKDENNKIDLISPDELIFRKDYFKCNKTFGCVSYFDIMSSHLTDQLLVDLLDTDTNICVNVHIQPIDQNKALKLIKRKVSDIDAMKIEEQKKANRNLYGEDLIPQELIANSDNSKKLLLQLQGDEKYFQVTLLVTNYASNKRDLQTNFDKSNALVQRSTNIIRKLDYQQEDGYISTVPLGVNLLKEKERGLTTYSLAILEPFTTQELFQQNDKSLYYGLNALSHNMIMCDRLDLLNPNGLILGKPGKSFSAKREIVNVFLTTNDPIMICDPEGEYGALVKALGGQVITISPTSNDYINPLDISLDYNADGNPIALKSNFMLSFFELIMKPHMVTPIDKGIIDGAVDNIYKEYFIDTNNHRMPTLTDLYEEIAKSNENAAQFITDSMKYYVYGNNNFFNHTTNVNMNNRIICFDIKEMSDQLKPLAMLIIQDFVWARVAANRKKKIHTWFYIDEFHLLLNDKETAEYSVAIWKRFRKWGGVPTGITQNIKDFLQSMKVENIFENSDFIYMLGQGPKDRELLAEKLGISDNQMSYLNTNDSGKGLLKYGNIILPFEDNFPRDTRLYNLITTKLEET